MNKGAESMKVGFFLSLLGLIFCLNSCAFHRLTVQTHYLSHENLASYYVYTPDPHLDNPIIGQRVLIQWALPSTYLAYGDLTLSLTVRFRNRNEEKITFLIKETAGTYLYYLVNDAYCESGGIATYKVDVTAGGCVLETWKHPLWVELITFDIPSENSDKKL